MTDRTEVLGVIVIGGVIGALSRYQIGHSWPTGTWNFPFATLTINLVGCFVIGLFLVAITEMITPHRLLRPFFGTGVLGGFTTFSSYALDITTLLRTGHQGLALAYLAATAIGGVVAVSFGMLVMRQLGKTMIVRSGPA